MACIYTLTDLSAEKWLSNKRLCCYTHALNLIVQIVTSDASLSVGLYVLHHCMDAMAQQPLCPVKYSRIITDCMDCLLGSNKHI